MKTNEIICFDVFVSEKITIKCDTFRVRTSQYTDEEGQKLWEIPSVREVGSTSGWYAIGNKERRRLESIGAFFSVDA